MCNDRIASLIARQLSGEASATELRELENLLHLNPAYRQTAQQLTHIWQSHSVPDADFMEATYLAHEERMKLQGINMNAETTEETQQSRFKKISFFKIVSAVAFVSLLILGSWKFFSADNDLAGSANNRAALANVNEVKTPRGARTKIQLPDGTNVWLNAGSKLSYDKIMDGKERVVFLTGEAFFDVVKNAKRPFIIHTSKIDIRVLGTQFNVKAYEEDKTTETSLLRGSVEVFLKSNPSKKYLLKPNEKLVLSNSLAAPAMQDIKQSETSKQDAAIAEPQVAITALRYLHDEQNAESSWTRNILSFTDESFSEVAKKMERWYNVTIEFKNIKWEDKFLSGSFENETLDQALAALKFTTGFKFNIEGNHVTIY